MSLIYIFGFLLQKSMTYRPIAIREKIAKMGYIEYAKVILVSFSNVFTFKTIFQELNKAIRKSRSNISRACF
jgi:DNA-directed RNA polymerase delta subunit